MRKPRLLTAHPQHIYTSLPCRAWLCDQSSSLPGHLPPVLSSSVQVGLSASAPRSSPRERDTSFPFCLVPSLRVSIPLGDLLLRLGLHGDALSPLPMGREEKPPFFPQWLRQFSAPLARPQHQSSDSVDRRLTVQGRVRHLLVNSK